MKFIIISETCTVNVKFDWMLYFRAIAHEEPLIVQRCVQNPNIADGAFSFAKIVNRYFHKKLQLRCLTGSWWIRHGFKVQKYLPYSKDVVICSVRLLSNLKFPFLSVSAEVFQMALSVMESCPLRFLSHGQGILIRERYHIGVSSVQVLLICLVFRSKRTISRVILKHISIQ